MSLQSQKRLSIFGSGMKERKNERRRERTLVKQSLLHRNVYIVFLFVDPRLILSVIASRLFRLLVALPLFWITEETFY